MTVIKVQKSSHIALMLFWIFFVFLACSLWWGMSTINKTNGNFFMSWYFGIAVILSTILSIVVLKWFVKKNYVSDLIVKDDELQLVYKSGNKQIVSIKKIPKSDIAQFVTVQSVNNVTSYPCRVPSVLSGYSQTTIYLIDGSKVWFEESCCGWRNFRCPYGFLLKLLDTRNSLPNFRYELDRLNMEDKEAVKDIELCAKTGKRLPFYKASPLKIIMVVLSLIPIICIIYFILLLITLQLGLKT